MDQQGLELVENQKESVVGRKALADKTKGEHNYFPLLYTADLACRVQKDSRGGKG